MINLLPKILYDFSLNETEKSQIILPNLLVRILPKISKDFDKLTFDYTIKDGETIEFISYKFYDNTEYHWLIMLINEKFDYINDFPLEQSALLKFCKSKYGEDKIYDIHHYEDENGNIVEEIYYDWKNETGNQPTGALAQLPIWQNYYETISQLKTKRGKPITNFEYEVRENDKKRSIKLIKPEYIGSVVANLTNVVINKY